MIEDLIKAEKRKRQTERLKATSEYIRFLLQENNRLEEELAKMTSVANHQQSCNMKRYFKLEQAKKIINAFLDFESVCMENGIKIADDIREQAEQFLKETEQ